jgi:hypothetical protein
MDLGKLRILERVATTVTEYLNRAIMFRLNSEES